MAPTKIDPFTLLSRIEELETKVAELDAFMSAYVKGHAQSHLILAEKPLRLTITDL